MHGEKRKIAVVGAGAIGGITAAVLTGAGLDVEVVCKHQETTDRASSPGLHVFGLKGDLTVPVKAVKNIADLSGLKDVVFLATKATEAVNAAQELLPFLHADSLVVSQQNGICEEALAKLIGRDRVIGCVVGWGATMHGPAELEMTSEGEFVIGNIDHRPDPRLAVIQEMLGEIVPTRISNNIMGELYAKLIINSCINSLGVLTGLRLGPMLAMKRVRIIFIEIMQEAMAVAAALGIKVEPGGGGKLDYYDFLARKGAISVFKRHLMVRIIGFKYRRVKPSSLQSVERGRKSEIDYLNGYICERARDHGIPTPINDAVVAIVKEIEAGSRQISLANINEPIFARI
ncbi:MAG: 2-dehydropantoate 2-reductase [Desulfomonile tiedjei]|nr:2-dehydropantoate 2-reductase [Desulfomonile tiedjei]